MARDDDDRVTVQKVPRTGEPSTFPVGQEWHCLTCDFHTNDAGPNHCPHDGSVLLRIRYWDISSTGEPVDLEEIKAVLRAKLAEDPTLFDEPGADDGA